MPDVTGIKGAEKLHPVEEIYGFGETWDGHLAQRGQAFQIWDRSGTPDECAWMPYFVSTENYAFFLNYGGRVRFDVGRSNAGILSFEMPARELEYTVVLGDNIASSVQHVVSLTGITGQTTPVVV